MNSEKLVYAEIKLGQANRFGSYAVTKEEIIEMAARWDPQPFHLDDKAAEDSVFGGITACSVHLMAMQSAIAHQNPTPLAVLAGLGIENLQIKAPARPGDVLSLESTLLEKRLSKTKPDRGIVKARMRLLNQNDDIIMEQLGSFLVLNKPPTNQN